MIASLDLPEYIEPIRYHVKRLTGWRGSPKIHRSLMLSREKKNGMEGYDQNLWIPYVITWEDLGNGGVRPKFIVPFCHHVGRLRDGGGGTPQGKVSCRDLGGLMRPKGQKERFGTHF